MFQYYGVDWIMSIILLYSAWLIGSRKRIGWLFGVVGCCFVIVFGIMTNSYPTIIVNIIFIILDIRGYLEWKDEDVSRI